MVEATRHDTPDLLLGLLREEAALCGRLEGFSQRQRSFIVSEQTEHLLAVLADRQRLSNRLSEIAVRLAPLRRDWDSQRRRWAPQQQSEADQLLRGTQARLQRVMESDERDARLLSARKELVSAALKQSHSAGQAMSAYGAVAAANGRANTRLDEAT